MTLQEFSDGFSTLLNSYGSQAQFGEQASGQQIVLDEYEKSSFLTQAQDIVLRSYCDRAYNPQAQGFDDSAQRQTDFSSLIKNAILSPETNSTVGTFDSRGIIYQIPKRSDNSSEVLFIIQEKLLMKKTSDNSIKAEYVIVPISAKEYDRQMSKSFGKPLKKQAWRLFLNKSTGFDVMTELIPRDTLPEGYQYVYKIRYVKRPQPIVLEDMPDGLTIDGVGTASECELNNILHTDILHKAVELAIATHSTPARQEARQEQQNGR